MRQWTEWQAIAEKEVTRILEGLPGALRSQAERVPVTYEPFPSPGLEEEGIASDTLGLFVGEPWAEEGWTSAPLPAQIILFIGNLVDLVEADEGEFRREVRTTFLHELGHYLGLDEDELEDRGLE